MRFTGLLRYAAAVLLPLLTVPSAFAWGHDGHSLINRLALASQPADAPAFLKSPAALDAIAFYGPEPDHWRNKSTEPELYDVESPNHFIDLEYAEVVGAFPKSRYDFLTAMAAALPKHPEFNLKHPDDVGILPYVIVEDYERLKNTMRTYRSVLAAKGDPKPVEAEIVFLAGILGHFVADGSQPLHTTMQYNGWNGPNPNGYSTEKKIHAAFEGDFVHNNLADLGVAQLIDPKAQLIADPFAEAMSYIHHTNSDVEPTYKLYKAGAFDGAGTPAGKAFVEERLAAGATELRNFIYTAWVRSGDPGTNSY
jgi:hypothetical protein